MTGPRGFAGNRPQGAERLRVGGSLWAGEAGEAGNTLPASREGEERAFL